MINKIICWMGVILISIHMSLSAQAFNVNSSSWTAGEATFHTSPFSNTGSGLSNTQLESAFSEAMDQWTRNTNFEFISTTGTADPCPSIVSSNPAENDNGFSFASASCSGGFGGSTLAVATTFFTVAPNATIQSGIVFNSAQNWDIYSGPQGFNTSFDFVRVAVHELGHSLGLAHTQNFNSAIMLPIVGDIEEPQQDDLEGVAFLYGAFVAPLVPVPPVVPVGPVDIFSYIPVILFLLLDDE